MAQQRWLLVALACGIAPPLLITLGVVDPAGDRPRADVLLYFAGQLLMYALLAYAVLRHRVFNFYFAVSRALVFSGVSLLLLCSFGLIQWLLAPVLHGEHASAAAEARSAVLVDAALAVGVFLLFTQIHGRIERQVERLFFHRWHDNEQRLRAWVAQSAQVASVEQLQDALIGALDRITGEAGAALYLRQANGEFALAASTLVRAAARIDANDALAVALRTDAAPRAAPAASAGGGLALPMCHRSGLHGFVVLGSKPRGETYRPDECDVLGFAVLQTGLGLHALRVDALERAVHRLAAHTAEQDATLHLLAGRRVLAHAGARQPVEAGR